MNSLAPRISVSVLLGMALLCCAMDAQGQNDGKKAAPPKPPGATRRPCRRNRRDPAALTSSGLSCSEWGPAMKCDWFTGRCRPPAIGDAFTCSALSCCWPASSPDSHMFGDAKHTGKSGQRKLCRWRT